MTPLTEKPTILARIRTRLAREEGFTVMIALGVLVVTSMLVAGTFAAVQADTPLAQRDLDGKRAYYAARAGLNRFTYELNQNPNLWQTCPEAAKTAIAPGSGQKYSYKWLPANGGTTCSPAPPVQGDPISTFIDGETGTFRMKFIGYSGNPEVSRGLVATFRKDTPLDYLWFTVYETLDPSTYNVPANYAACAAYERDSDPPGAPGYNRPSYCSDIQWITGDDLNGPSYTQDQYLISGSPVFGRLNTNDKTESAVPSSDPNAICTNSACGAGQFRGQKSPNAPMISPPPDNDELRVDAERYGLVVSGVTFITLNGSTASVQSCLAPGTCTTLPAVSIGNNPPGSNAREPIIYVADGPNGCTDTYSPYHPTYPTGGHCGTVYVKGTYNRSLTIAADRDVIVEGNIIKGSNAPVPVLGLVANNFVRVMHGINGRAVDADRNECGSPGTNQTSAPDRTLENLRIDAAILAIKHSFIVDNYDCGSASQMGELTINGAIAQYFRGTVGTGGSSGASTGYLKDYNYDDRLSVAQPPFLFDIASSAWHISRETLCVPNGLAASTTCG
jgi:hypothetical protein